MDRTLRKFVATVNYKYLRWVHTLENVGQVDKQWEACIPECLYKQMMRGVSIFADYKQASDIKVATNRKNYHPSRLWKTILTYTRYPTITKGYKIDEFFLEINLKSESDFLIMMACLVCEGTLLIRTWNKKIEENIFLSPEEAIFFREKGLILIYVLVFEIEAPFLLSEQGKRIYKELWSEMKLEESERRFSLEKELLKLYFECIKDIYGEYISEDCRRAYKTMQEQYVYEAHNAIEEEME